MFLAKANKECLKPVKKYFCNHVVLFYWCLGFSCTNINGLDTLIFDVQLHGKKLINMVSVLTIYLSLGDDDSDGNSHGLQ